MASFDFANLGVAPAGVELTIEQKSGDGNFLLPADQLQSSVSWVVNMESTIQFSQGTGDVAVEVTGDMTTVQNFQVLSVDPVEFEGQTVPGIQLEQENTIDKSM